jgi:hypothetical protein
MALDSGNYGEVAVIITQLYLSVSALLAFAVPVQFRGFLIKIVRGSLASLRTAPTPKLQRLTNGSRLVALKERGSNFRGQYRDYQTASYENLHLKISLSIECSMLQ